MSNTDIFNTLITEAHGLASEDGENPEYDRALVELIIRVTPGLSHDDTERISALVKNPAALNGAEVTEQLTLFDADTTDVIEVRFADREAYLRSIGIITDDEAAS